VESLNSKTAPVLIGRIPLGLVAEDPTYVSTFSTMRTEVGTGGESVSSPLQVFVLGLGEYLQTFWAALAPALQLYKSIQQAAAAPQEV
jgi:hypothetical protein